MSIPTQIVEGLKNGGVVPYLGPAVLELVPGGAPVPRAPEGLVGMLTSKVSVPHKIRTRLTAAAQFIENFKHRKTLVANMALAFTPTGCPVAAALPDRRAEAAAGRRYLVRRRHGRRAGRPQGLGAGAGACPVGALRHLVCAL